MIRKSTPRAIVSHSSQAGWTPSTSHNDDTTGVTKTGRTCTPFIFSSIYQSRSQSLTWRLRRILHEHRRCRQHRVIIVAQSGGATVAATLHTSRHTGRLDALALRRLGGAAVRHIAQRNIALQMHFGAVRELKHRTQLRGGRRLTVTRRRERTDDVRIQRAAVLIDQRNAAVALVERETVEHPNAVRGVRLRQLGTNGVRPAVDGLADTTLGARLKELEQYVRVLVTRQTGFAACDHVEFVVGQLERAMDAHGQLDGALLGALRFWMGRIWKVY